MNPRSGDLGAPLAVAGTSIAIGVLYLVGTLRQLLCHESVIPQDTDKREHAAKDAKNAQDPWNAEEQTPVEAQDALSMRCTTLAHACLLTPCERDVLELLARGRSARYVAEELGVSFNTVRTHIRHVYEKLGIHSRQDLIDLVEIAQAPEG